MRQFLFITFLLGLMSLPAVYFFGDVTAQVTTAQVTPPRPGATAVVPKATGKVDGARDPATFVEDALGALYRVGVGLAASLFDAEAPGEPPYSLALPAGEIAHEANIESDIGRLTGVSGGPGRALSPGRISIADARTGSGRPVVTPLATVDDLENTGAPPRLPAPGLGGQRLSGPQRASIDLATAYSGSLGLRRVHPTSINWFDLV